MTDLVRMLEDERDRLVYRAHLALDEAENAIAQLRENLGLATSGQPYKRVPGAGTGSFHSAPVLDAGPVYAAFDAIERVALIPEEEREET